MNHAAIGVGPLRHHKSSCCERSSDAITPTVKAKQVLSLYFVFLRCFVVLMERCVHMFQRRGTFSVVVSSFWWDGGKK